MNERSLKIKGAVQYLLIGSAALVCRFLFLGRQSFGMDESFSCWVAQHSLSEIVSLLHYDAHPPLFYMFLHFWEMGGNSVIYLRIPFALCGAVNIILLYFFGEEFLGKRMGYFTGGIWACSFYALKYESWCRMYALAVTLSLLATWFFWKAFKQPSGKAWGRYFVFAVLSIYTHYYTAFILLAHWIFLLFHSRRREALLGLICIAIAYLPWFPVFFFQIEHKVSQGFPMASITTPFIILAGLLAAFHFFLRRFWYFILGFLDLTAWISGLIVWRKSEKEKTFLFFLLFSVPFLLPLMITWVTPMHIFSARYAIIFLPYFIFPIVKGVQKLSFVVWFPFLVSSLAINLYMSSLYLTSPVYQRQDFKLAAQKIQGSLISGDTLLVEQISSLFPLAYYLPNELNVKWDPKGYLVPVDPGKSNLNWYGISGTHSLPFVKKVAASSERVWLVMCQQELVDPDWSIYAYLKSHDIELHAYKIRSLSPFDDIYIFLFRRRDLK